jgi:hypothetical protein
VLRCYCLFNWDLGYCQGMSDLASPLLVVMQGDEVGACADKQHNSLCSTAAAVAATAIGRVRSSNNGMLCSSSNSNSRQACIGILGII